VNTVIASCAQHHSLSADMYHLSVTCFGQSVRPRTGKSGILQDRQCTKAHPFVAIHSADENRMIYSSSNTTSYSTFYAFFSSFRITLWPLWLANDSLVFIYHSHTHKKAHRTDQKKLTNLMGNLCCTTEHSV